MHLSKMHGPNVSGLKSDMLKPKVHGMGESSQTNYIPCVGPKADATVGVETRT